MKIDFNATKNVENKLKYIKSFALFIAGVCEEMGHHLSPLSFIVR